MHPSPARASTYQVFVGIWVAKPRVPAGIDMRSPDRCRRAEHRRGRACEVTRSVPGGLLALDRVIKQPSFTSPHRGARTPRFSVQHRSDIGPICTSEARSVCIGLIRSHAGRPLGRARTSITATDGDFLRERDRNRMRLRRRTLTRSKGREARTTSVRNNAAFPFCSLPAMLQSRSGMSSRCQCSARSLAAQHASRNPTRSRR